MEQKYEYPKELVLEVYESEEERQEAEEQRRLTALKEIEDARNGALLSRYYFYRHLYQIDYRTVVSLLCKEFYLKYATVVNTLTDSHHQSDNKTLTVRQLEEKYPYYCWDITKLLNTNQ